LLDREDLLKLVSSMARGGVALSFHGKRSAMEIQRRVRPRVTRRISELHIGSPEEQSKNVLVEGENLQAMVTLYKHRGQVDLVLTDPPYNTGQQFRYNDRWDTDPNDPDLGTLVTMEDGSRHTKWMKAMMPRLQMMHAMLRPQGVLAICIDDHELFHLGMMLDEIFGEHNRLAIINWQKTTSKNDSSHVAKVTEYILVYAKDAERSKTALLPPSAKAVARFKSVDGDRRRWKQGDLSAREYRPDTSSYQIQSPFTGEFHPPGKRHWANTRKQVREWLEEWGSTYQDLDLGDGCAPALALTGWSPGLAKGKAAALLARARERATARLAAGSWPRVYFGNEGQSKPVFKVYEDEVRSGIVPLTFWEDFDVEPYELGSVSWEQAQTGRSREGTEEFKSLVGSDVVFETIKPLKLFQKIIQIWCPAGGLVLDPYAGSGTTGHAVLALNHATGTNRRFILIEQGRPESGDKYARTLTRTRLANAITGTRPNGAKGEPLGGGFEFRMLTSQIDAKTVLSMRRDELIDVVITSHWDSSNRNAPSLIRIDDPKYRYLVGRNDAGEGYFIIWNGDGPVGQLDVETYKLVLQEAKRAELKTPYHIYARYEVYQTRSVIFYKIPDRILAHLGLSEASDSYNDDSEG
jgi:adenine-specific DNA-methyltransferase